MERPVLPVPPPGQPVLTARPGGLSPATALRLLGACLGRVVPQLLLRSRLLDPVPPSAWTDLGTSHLSEGLKHVIKFKHELPAKCVFSDFCKQGLKVQEHR